MWRRTAFRWTIHFEDPLMASEVEERVADVLATWQELYPKIYSDGWMAGSALGVIQVGLVVFRRDRWDCDRAARKFAGALAIRARVRVQELWRPEQANLPPHNHHSRFQAEVS